MSSVGRTDHDLDDVLSSPPPDHRYVRSRTSIVSRSNVVLLVLVLPSDDPIVGSLTLQAGDEGVWLGGGWRWERWSELGGFEEEWG